MTRTGRIVAVTAGLTGAGAIAGAVAGGAALGVSLWLTTKLLIPGGFLIGAFLGAPLGAVTAPAVAWLLLRDVSLGHMFVACATGTIIGGVIGYITTTPGGSAVLGGLAGALVGCVVAAVWLRRRLEA